MVNGVCCLTRQPNVSTDSLKLLLARNETTLLTRYIHVICFSQICSYHKEKLKALTSQIRGVMWIYSYESKSVENGGLFA